jgi:hypothetical protein
MKRNALPGNAGFVLDYDLSHSMMIVGARLSSLSPLASLVIRQRIKANPDLLAREKRTRPLPPRNDQAPVPFRPGQVLLRLVGDRIIERAAMGVHGTTRGRGLRLDHPQ